MSYVPYRGRFLFLSFVQFQAKSQSKGLLNFNLGLLNYILGLLDSILGLMLYFGIFNLYFVLPLCTVMIRPQTFTNTWRTFERSIILHFIELEPLLITTSTKRSVHLPAVLHLCSTCRIYDAFFEKFSITMIKEIFTGWNNLSLVDVNRRSSSCFLIPND